MGTERWVGDSNVSPRPPLPTMPDSTRPQDVSPEKPVVDGDERQPPTPQGRADGEAAEGDGPSTGTLDTEGEATT